MSTDKGTEVAEVTEVAAGGIRKRMRLALTAEILRVGREHLARDGAAALSLRAVARDVDLVPSALYRYYPGRDALLTALVIDSYASLADVTEAADPGVDHDGVTRWVAMSQAIRSWAISRPQEWSLIFGSPVPGYEAPQETVAYYVRIVDALTAPVRDGYAAKTIMPPDLIGPLSRPVSRELSTIADALLPGLPKSAALVLVISWEQLVGAISLEVFGHWRNTIEDAAIVFAHTARVTAGLAGLT